MKRLSGLAAVLFVAGLATAPALSAGPIYVTASPANATGPCPAVITFNASIQTNTFAFHAGQHQITYTWTRSDGATSPIVTATPNSDGVVVAQDTWTLGGAALPNYSGWEAIKILSPVALTSSQANFTLSCGSGNTPTPRPRGEMPRECDTTANLLKNGLFSSGGPPTTYTGLYESGSAAPPWTLFSNTSTTIKTDWLSSYAGRSGVIHVVTGAARSGLEQVFLPQGSGPAHAHYWAWVYIARGSVAIGTGNGGDTGFDATESSTGHWALVEAANGVSPANEAIIYANGIDGADFYVDKACVLPDSTSSLAPVSPLVR